MDLQSFAPTPTVRRRMQAIHARDTRPEKALRSILHAAGFRYRVHYRPVPQLNRTADIVFVRDKLAVFVDGCFWHGCPEHGRRQFAHNAWYWPDKIERNRRRDRDTNMRLEAAGWSVLRFWEHEEPSTAAGKVESTLLCLRATNFGAKAGEEKLL